MGALKRCYDCGDVLTATKHMSVKGATQCASCYNAAYNSKVDSGEIVPFSVKASLQSDPLTQLYYETLARFHKYDYAKAIGSMSDGLRLIVEGCTKKLANNGNNPNTSK